jgi:hypothetical protein
MSTRDLFEGGNERRDRRTRTDEFETGDEWAELLSRQCWLPSGPLCPLAFAFAFALAFAFAFPLSFAFVFALAFASGIGVVKLRLGLGRL